MLKIDQYAYINRLSGVHPLEKLVLSLATMLICLAVSSPAFSLVVIICMAGMVTVAARIPVRFFLKLMLAPVIFLVVGVLTVAFVWTEHPSGAFWGWRLGQCYFGVTGQGLAAAGSLFLRSLAAVACLYFLSLTTPAVDLFSVLRSLRVPSLFVELMSLVYRYIFVLLDTADKIYVSQASRWGYASLRTSYVSLGQLISNLFTKASHNYRMLYQALNARCYAGELRVLENSYVFSWRNLALILLFEAALLLLSLWLAGSVPSLWGGVLG
ncbi:MAG: cobalt ECF transporter T component CbiQ [Thermacetogeniaceae bacterium]